VSVRMGVSVGVSVIASVRVGRLFNASSRVRGRNPGESAGRIVRRTTGAGGVVVVVVAVRACVGEEGSLGLHRV
jgi:hypothetical protein